MRAMRAESFTGYGGLKLVEVPRPSRADGRVLVRITAAGVTPLDHTILSGGYPTRAGQARLDRNRRSLRRACVPGGTGSRGSADRRAQVSS